MENSKPTKFYMPISEPEVGFSATIHLISTHKLTITSKVIAYNKHSGTFSTKDALYVLAGNKLH